MEVGSPRLMIRAGYFLGQVFKQRLESVSYREKNTW